MINILHLLWIVPLSAMIGFMWSAIFTIGKRADEQAYLDKNKI